MLSQPDSPNTSTTNPLSQLAQKMFSDENDSNSEIMIAAIVLLLLVILFVLLLHVYAKWFLAQSQLQSRARRRQPRATVTGAPGTSHFNHINIETPPISTKGLDSATVSAIPTFVCEYETEEAETEEAKTEEFECVICLSEIEEGEIGRRLPKCGHAFHVECIDMWLSSHCNCPICRAPIVVHQNNNNNNQNDSQLGSVHGGGGSGDFEIVIGTPSYDEISESERGVSGSVVSVSEETSLSLLLGFSLKKMLSKVFLSSHVNELD